MVEFCASACLLHAPLRTVIRRLKMWHTITHTHSHRGFCSPVASCSGPCLCIISGLVPAHHHHSMQSGAYPHPPPTRSWKPTPGACESCGSVYALSRTAKPHLLVPPTGRECTCVCRAGVWSSTPWFWSDKWRAARCLRSCHSVSCWRMVPVTAAGNSRCTTHPPTCAWQVAGRDSMVMGCNVVGQRLNAGGVVWVGVGWGGFGKNRIKGGSIG